MSLANSIYRLSQTRRSVDDAWRECLDHRHVSIQFGQTMGFVHVHNRHEFGGFRSHNIFFRLHTSNDVFQRLNIERVSRRHISARLPWGELGRFKIFKGAMRNCFNDEYIRKVLTLHTNDQNLGEPSASALFRHLAEKSSICAGFCAWRRFVFRTKSRGGRIAALMLLHKYNITEVELRRSIIVKSGLCY